MSDPLEKDMVNGSGNEAVRHTAQAREFLDRAGQHLADGDLHQASEKGWGAAAHMAKAVALVQGWEYDRHSHFHRVMNQARRLSGNGRLPFLHGRAEILHVNFYELTGDLDPVTIGEDLTSMGELLDVLEPLTAKA